MLTKGVVPGAMAFQGLDSEIAERQFDLVRIGAERNPGEEPLRGRSVDARRHRSGRSAPEADVPAAEHGERASGRGTRSVALVGA